MNKNNFQKVLFALGAIFFIYAFCYTIILFFHFDLGDVIDSLSAKEANEIGDTVGGILNPLFAISICIFTGLAFYAQYEANKQVQDQFNNERTLALIYKAMDNKNEFLQSCFNKENKLNLVDEIRELSKQLKYRIIENLRYYFVYETEDIKENASMDKNSKRVINELRLAIGEDEKKRVFDKMFKEDFKNVYMIDFFINNNSNSFVKEKIKNSYIFIQLIIQRYPNFVYRYITQVNYIIEQISIIKNPAQLYNYFYSTLRNEEMCLLLYLYLYSIPKIVGYNKIILDEIKLDARFIEKIQSSELSINYSNELLIGEITIKQMIEEVKRIEKYCEEFPIQLD
ncbi:MAG: hypothetical protein ACK5UE_01605 [Chitinophagales bacterium]|jgi:uncharacterized protein YjgD (DUF1641 family)|nr:hypothetical protein [Sphingobacteriales bacterium]